MKIKNKCDECKKKSETCYRSNNKRYKLYICKECKSKEDNNTANAEKAKPVKDITQEQVNQAFNSYTKQIANKLEEDS